MRPYTKGVIASVRCNSNGKVEMVDAPGAPALPDRVAAPGQESFARYLRPAPGGKAPSSI